MSFNQTQFYLSFNPEKDFRNKNLTKLLLQFAKGEILDIGCGIGYLLHCAKNLGIKGVGIEPEAKFVKEAERLYGKLNIISLNLEDVRLERKFNTVFLVDVLEDIKDDENILKKAKQFLIKGGRIIITVPAHPTLFGTRDKLMGYYRRYTMNDLIYRLNKLGFKIIYKQYWNFLGLLIYYLNFKIFRKEFSLVRMPKKYFFSSFLNFWFKIIENHINFGIGLSIIIVAEINELVENIS